MLRITSTTEEDTGLTAIQIGCTKIMFCTAMSNNTRAPVTILSTRIRVINIIGVACRTYLIGLTCGALKIEQVFVTRTSIFDSTPTGIHCGRAYRSSRTVYMMNNHVVLTTQQHFRLAVLVPVITYTVPLFVSTRKHIGS